MGKKKIKAITLVGFWKKINKIAPSYVNSSQSEADDLGISTLLEEINNSNIPESIAQNFLTPYLYKQKGNVVFIRDDVGNNGKVSKYDEETCTMYIDIIEFYKYIAMFNAAAAELEGNLDIKDDFNNYRQLSFMKAISKLPVPYFFYITTLQRIAVVNDVVSVENKEGGYIKSNVSFYLSTLWAFKEFERFYLTAQHRNVRADFGIIWHEGQWVQDTRTRGYA